MLVGQSSCQVNFFDNVGKSNSCTMDSRKRVRAEDQKGAGGGGAGGARTPADVAAHKVLEALFDRTLAGRVLGAANSFEQLRAVVSALQKKAQDIDYNFGRFSRERTRLLEARAEYQRDLDSMLLDGTSEDHVDMKLIRQRLPLIGKGLADLEEKEAAAAGAAHAFDGSLGLGGRARGHGGRGRSASRFRKPHRARGRGRSRSRR